LKIMDLPMIRQCVRDASRWAGNDTREIGIVFLHEVLPNMDYL
jgi:hypothetical protein